MTKNIATRSGGEILVDQLLVHGVDTAFCVPGESYLDVLNALSLRKNKIKLIVTRQDGSASFMAEAFGKATGRPGICFVTRGPGATNASIGVHTAFQDSSPMVLFVGQVGGDMVEREAFQEIDYRRMFGQMTKWVAQIDRADRIPEYVARAFQVATSGRPGPVVLALPEDMLVSKEAVADAKPIQSIRYAADNDSLSEIRKLLSESKKPLLLLGGSGWTEKACENIKTFSERNNLPVACTFRRQDLIDNRHSNYVGDVGIGINPKLADVVRNSDLLLVVGARLGEMTTGGYSLLKPPVLDKRLVHIHPGVEELGRVFQAEVMVNADLESISSQLSSMDPVECNWGDWRLNARKAYEENVVPVSMGGDVDLAEVMQIMERKLPRDTVMVNGAGNFSGWIHRYWKYSGYRSQLAPTNGAMGYGVPAGIAAKVAFPNRTVVSVSGDGCFLMNGQELATAAQYDLKLLFLVFNNGMYGTIRMHQEREYPNHVYGTSLKNPDFAALARAYGLHGATVESTSQFEEELMQALSINTASLIEIKTDPNIITTRTTLDAIRNR
ncbi:MAG: thiamine pyrophosphate-binding protein [Burkholderiales bacterium]